jgi:hypothetical protein
MTGRRFRRTREIVIADLAKEIADRGLTIGGVCILVLVSAVLVPTLMVALIVADIHFKVIGFRYVRSRRGAPPDLLRTLERLRELDDPPIHGAPGWRLHRFASWVYSRQSFKIVFEPVLSDMQVEYFEALAKGQRKKAAWVRLRGCLVFGSHVAAQLPISAVRVIWRMWTAG